MDQCEQKKKLSITSLVFLFFHPYSLPLLPLLAAKNKKNE
jgi:hypothetical protein